MSLLSIALKAEAEAARRALVAAGHQKGEIWLAVHRAADCAADLDRAERLLDSERSSAEAARAALDRALQLYEIEAEQQRRAAEAAEIAPAKRRKKGGSL